MDQATSALQLSAFSLHSPQIPDDRDRPHVYVLSLVSFLISQYRENTEILDPEPSDLSHAALSVALGPSFHLTKLWFPLGQG